MLDKESSKAQTVSKLKLCVAQNTQKAFYPLKGYINTPRLFVNKVLCMKKNPNDNHNYRHHSPSPLSLLVVSAVVEIVVVGLCRNSVINIEQHFYTLRPNLRAGDSRVMTS